ncbi:hypothetical protein CRYUN_Cryun23aG0105700 [Craigia yunnanensis]
MVDCTMMTDEVENVIMRSSSKFMQRRVNCVMVVANIAEIYKALKAGDFKSLEATRQLFCSPAFRKSKTNGVYDIVCLTEYGFLVEESDPVSAYALTEAVYRALLISDRGHFPKKKFQDWALLILLCDGQIDVERKCGWIMEGLRRLIDNGAV